MSEIKIKCPTCGKILRLKDAPNINAASFTCPVCHEKHIVGKCQRYAEQPQPTSSCGDETQYRGNSVPQPGGEETRLASGTWQGNGDETRIDGAPSVTIGMLVDNKGTEYRLCSGLNTIGRKAISSSASVQIATDDRTMSRSHAVIEVRSESGHTINIIRNGANKNPSYLNGSLIGKQDQLILKNGDRIKMGNTELTFKN